MSFSVSVQQEDFDLASESKLLTQNTETGALVSFVGLVRDINDNADVADMFLEHYPGMTEKSISAIIEQAFTRWRLHTARVIHRIGHLQPGDQIVFVGVSARHRGDAFNACEFIMDYLKTEAPFWKKERTASGDRWVEAHQEDEVARERWNESR